MKAEHRKELETNTLADKMGQAVQRVKGGQRSTFLIYVIVIAVLLVGAWFLYAYLSTGRQEQSTRWLLVDDGSRANLEFVSKSEPNSAAGKSARLQIAWFRYWEGGIKFFGTDPNGAMQELKDASDRYRDLAKDCEDDPIFLPQALLGIAVVEEVKTVQDPSALESAEKAYKLVIEKHDGKFRDTVQGKFAQARLDQLKDPQKRKEIVALYEDLQRDPRIRIFQHPAIPNFPKDGELPPLPVMPPIPKK